MIRDGIKVRIAAGIRSFTPLSNFIDFVPYDTSCKKEGEEIKSRKSSVFVASRRTLIISGALLGFLGPLKSACLRASSICRFESCFNNLSSLTHVITLLPVTKFRPW